MTRVPFMVLALLILITTTTLARGQQNEQPYLGVRTVIGEQGTQVVEIVPGSPAETAGFRVNDVIIAVNDTVVSTTNPLEAILNQLRPGTVVQFTVLRGADRLTITVMLGTRLSATLPATALPTSAATLLATLQATPAVSTIPAGSGVYLGIRLSGSSQGVNIVEVVPQSPADVAGLKTSDVIVAVDNQNVQRVEQVQAILSRKAAGDTVALRIRRNDALVEITVRLAARPGAGTTAPATPFAPVPAIPATPNPFPFGTPHLRMGVNYLVVTPQVAARLNLSVDYGALVTEVMPNSPADFAGIKLNDVITAVEGDKVDAKRTLVFRLLPYNPGDTITLTVVRGSQTLQIPVTLTSAGSGLAPAA